MTTIQKGDIVLVTGATGYIGSHVVEELLAAGYKVRGTSRTKDKAAYLTNVMDKKFGKGNLEIVEVPDMIADDAYTDAVKGVSGIVHLASIVTFSSDPEEVIPPTVKGTLNVLEAATTEPKVKSIVYTSSSTAALSPVANEKIIVTKDTWNDAAVERVRTSASPSAYGKLNNQTTSNQNHTDQRPADVYSASKTEAERALWAAVKSTNPSVRVSSVLPSVNYGTRFRETGNSTADWVIGSYTGKDRSLSQFPPQYFINVSDDAKLHVAALIDPACNGERIFGFTAPQSYNHLLAVFRKLEPGRDFGVDADIGEDVTEVPNKEAEELLRKHYGHGFVGLEETVKQCIAPVVTE
jgi:nucleoside-diphosphate-sugar epimerase